MAKVHLSDPVNCGYVITPDGKIIYRDDLPDPNPKQLYGDKKIKLQLVPPSASIAIANGLEEGAEKYGAWNWRDSKVEAMTYYGAVLRHLTAWLEGEDIDPDSEHGKTHLEGAIASLSILIDAGSCDTLIDNRPKVKSTGALGSLKKGSRKELL